MFNMFNMFNPKLPHMLCAKCRSKVARDAYYCKNCGEVIDDAVAPGLKVEDRRFSSKLVFALERHLVRNVIVTVLLALFLASGVKLGLHYLSSVKDNGSSKIYKLTVMSAANPMTCRGAICHILIEIKNKSNEIQKLETIPDLVSTTGVRYKPADPARMGNGGNNCRQKISITLKPHESIRYIGICAADIPIGTRLALAELRDFSGGLAVSGAFTAFAS